MLTIHIYFKEFLMLAFISSTQLSQLVANWRITVNLLLTLLWVKK